MAYDIFGEYYESTQDIYEKILPVVKTLKKYNLFYNSGTKQGFSLISNNIDENVSKTNCNGFYFIFYRGILVYIGECSGKNTIHTRISRYIKTILGNNTEDETHPAAQKHLNFFGKFVDDFEVSVLEMNFKDQKEARSIEKMLVRKFTPMFNKF